MSVKLAEIEEILELWAPRWAAWERDNVGLQVGRRSRGVNSILVALDVTPAVVDEAVKRKVDLIVSHHPLLFRPPSSVSDSTPSGSLLLSLAENRIALYSAHTNLDAAPDGVSVTLARVLGVGNPEFLLPLRGTLVKIVVFVPSDHADRVAEAMGRAGAGTIGEYTSCSFRTKGTGTFVGSSKSRPFAGKAQQLERVDEIRLEMLAPKGRLQPVLGAMKSAHPYEEVAYDVLALENENPNFGMGAIGNLPKAVPLRSFLARLKKAIHAESVRYTGKLDALVRRVAVCGGSGSELIDHAIRADADVFVTGDVKYHPFQDAAGHIALVDAGHWETEHVILPVIASKLREWSGSERKNIKVFVTQHSTNPIHSY